MRKDQSNLKFALNGQEKKEEGMREEFKTFFSRLNCDGFIFKLLFFCYFFFILGRVNRCPKTVKKGLKKGKNERMGLAEDYVCSKFIFLET